jgi:hypothetical protein
MALFFGDLGPFGRNVIVKQQLKLTTNIVSFSRAFMLIISINHCFYVTNLQEVNNSRKLIL